MRRHKTLAFFELALSGNLNQLLGNITDFLFDFGFFGLPRGTAQNIKLDVFILYAVARQDINIFNRHKQLGVIGINDFEAVMRGAAGNNIFQPHKTADAMLNMHHQVTHSQSRDIGNKILGSDFFGMTAVLAFSQNILLGDQQHIITLEAVR